MKKTYRNKNIKAVMILQINPIQQPKIEFMGTITK